MELGDIWKRLVAPYRFKRIKSSIEPGPVRVLDVGCGNNSCRITRYWLQVAEYHGVDRERPQQDRSDYELMDRFFMMDLESGDLSEIPDGYYDVIILSHVIEHLRNGLDVLTRLVSKMRPGGVIYVETPSERTLHLPSAIGFLNFHDDPTHRRLYSVYEMANALMLNECKVRSAGIRRDWVRLAVLSPVAVALNILYYLPFRRRFYGSGLWDALGVAVFVCAVKE